MPNCPTCDKNIPTTPSDTKFRHIICDNCTEELFLDEYGYIFAKAICSHCEILNPLTGGLISCRLIPGYHGKPKPKIDWEKMPHGNTKYTNMKFWEKNKGNFDQYGFLKKK